MPKSLHHPEYQELISLLTAERKRLKLTQTALAALIGKPQNFISKYETYEQRLDVQEYAMIARAMRYDWTRALSEHEQRREQERRLDEELEQTFPASDPLPYRRDGD